MPPVAAAGHAVRCSVRRSPGSRAIGAKPAHRRREGASALGGVVPQVRSNRPLLVAMLTRFRLLPRTFNLGITLVLVAPVSAAQTAPSDPAAAKTLFDQGRALL